MLFTEVPTLSEAKGSDPYSQKGLRSSPESPCAPWSQDSLSRVPLVSSA